MTPRGRLAAAAAAVLALPLIVITLVLATVGGNGAAAGSTPGPVPAAAIAGGGSAAANEALGARLAAGYKWAGTQVTCLDELWTRESGWRQTAKNATSGAYGVAQALGHAEGATLAQNKAGDNYPATFAAGNPPPWGNSDAAAQISWGLSYIEGTYGTPCQAWAHEEADGFY